MGRLDRRVELADRSVVGYAETGDPVGHPVLYLHGRASSRLEIDLAGIRDAAGDLGLRVLAPDRPGIGLTAFQRYTIRDYPSLVQGFADAMGLGQFAVIGVSGGGKYACACAWQVAHRLTRVTIVSSTCSFDLPGAQATWNDEDRRVYPIARRAPWLVRLYLAKFGRDIRRNPAALSSMFEGTVGPADREVLADQGFYDALRRDVVEAFRQGSRGPAHDYTLEARPWEVPLDMIGMPIEIWHGDDDRVVSPQQSRILAGTLKDARVHLVPGEGHFSLFASHAEEILQLVASG